MGLGHCLLTHRLWTLHGEYSSLRHVQLHKLSLVIQPIRPHTTSQPIRVYMMSLIIQPIRMRMTSLVSQLTKGQKVKLFPLNRPIRIQGMSIFMLQIRAFTGMWMLQNSYHHFCNCNINFIHSFFHYNIYAMSQHKLFKNGCAKN